VLEIRDLHAGYDYLQVLWGVSLHVAEGEFVSLVGPNGAGKTTTLKTIAGLLKLTQGDILFRGRSISHLPPHRICQLGIGLVSEALNLFERMSVYENLLLGGYAIQDKTKRGVSLDFVFSLFPSLSERRHQLAGTLSGGERKMLAIGRGLMSAPAVLLVDEPSLGLAPLLTRTVLEALISLRRNGLTILLVEQNVNLTLSMTDRTYVLEQGRILLEGQSNTLLHDEHIRRGYLGI
jgi:ABC-type branched-subunit amino acid transport system ATPase component